MGNKINDIERAIETLKVRKKFVADINIDAIVAYDLAIEALEKQSQKEMSEKVCGHMEVCQTYWCNKFDTLCSELCREEKERELRNEEK